MDRIWIGKWGLLPPEGFSVPISTSHSRCKHPSLELGFSLSLEHPDQQAAGVQQPPGLAWGHGEKPMLLLTLDGCKKAQRITQGMLLPIKLFEMLKSITVYHL